MKTLKFRGFGRIKLKTISWTHTAVLLASSLMLLCHGSTANAGVMFAGVIDLDYTSSIVGAPRNTRYNFSVTLSRTAKDIVHQVRENDFLVGPSGVKGVTFEGYFADPSSVAITDFRMALDPTSIVGTFNPSGLIYDLANSIISSVDANAAVGLTEPFNEHLSLLIPVQTPDSPISSVTLNFYNSSSVFDPVSFGSRQLILDASTPDNGFTLDDLFLDGLETFGDFQSTRDRVDGEPKALVDPVYFNSTSGTLGAGTIRDFRTVPEPSSFVIFGLATFGIVSSRRVRHKKNND